MHHLYLDVEPRTGAIKLNFPDLEVDELRESCVLDVADRGGATLEEVGAALNVVRERIRQVEQRVLDRISPHFDGFDEGRSFAPTRRRLPLVLTTPSPLESPMTMPVSCDHLPPALRRQLVDYCASMDRGALDTTVVAWLRVRGVRTSAAPALLDELVAEGHLVRVQLAPDHVRYAAPGTGAARASAPPAPPAPLAFVPAPASATTVVLEPPPVRRVVVEASTAPAPYDPTAPVSVEAFSEMVADALEAGGGLRPLDPLDQVRAAIAGEPRTIDELVEVLPGLPRLELVRLLLQLWDAREAQRVDGRWSRFSGEG